MWERRRHHRVSHRAHGLRLPGVGSAAAKALYRRQGVIDAARHQPLLDSPPEARADLVHVPIDRGSGEPLAHKLIPHGLELHWSERLSGNVPVEAA